MKKDIIRTAANKKREANTPVEEYVGKDILFWASFTKDIDKLDDLAESIFYLERKNGLEWGKEQNARWLVEKIVSICKQSAEQLKPKPVKQKKNIDYLKKLV